jgi:cytochrome c
VSVPAGRCAALAAVSVACLAAACGSEAPTVRVAGGDPGQGRERILHYGCVTCHVIGGIATANGHVGPPLTNFDVKRAIAHALPNRPSNVELWIRHPQQVKPGSDMPELGVSAADAADIAAYLYGQ